MISIDKKEHPMTKPCSHKIWRLPIALDLEKFVETQQLISSITVVKDQELILPNGLKDLNFKVLFMEWQLMQYLFFYS